MVIPRLRRFLCLLCIGLFMVLMVQPLTIKAIEAFEVLDYIVDIEVHADGTYRIQETITVDFDRPRHGLTIALQEEYDDVMFDVNGQTITKDYTFPISDITILSDHHYDIDESNGWVDILFGDSDVYVQGQQTYSFAYTLNTRDLDLDGIQLLYQNIISPDWDTTIHHVSFTIDLPKPIDGSTIQFYTTGTTMEDYLTWEYSDQTITGETIAPFGYGHGITMYIQLPQGYFTYPRYNGVMMLLIASILVVISMILYWIYGKEKETITPIITYKVPDGCTSAEAGYLLDGSIDGEDISSLVFEWAMKGYLTMEEKGESSLILCKTDKPITDLKPYEQKLFDAIFTTDRVDVDKLPTSLYEVINTVKRSIMRQYRGSFRLHDHASTIMQGLTILLAPLPLTINIASYYSFMMVENPLLLGAIIYMFVLVGVGLIYGLSIKNVRKSENMNHHNWTYLLMCLLVMLVGALTMIPRLLQGALAGLATAIILYVALHMERRSHYYNQQLNQIIGLYDYIQYAKADEINMVFKANPYIYYDVLPYAYAFGLTQVWSDHFNDIEMPLPPYYVGHMTYWDWMWYHRMNYAFNHLSHPPVPIEHTNGHHGGSIGGFGGGGFSGGGFGGSHGGSW